MADITVIGSFVMDMVAAVDAFPASGQTVLGKSLARYPGGKGANQAVAAKRMGADVEIIGCLGEDENGRIFRELLAKEGIGAARVKASRELPTGCSQIQIDREGENRIVVIPAANYGFTLQDLAAVESVLARTKLVMTQLELSQEVTESLAAACARLDVPLLLNPAPAAKLPRGLLSQITYLTPNETELEALTGIPADSEENLYAAADALLEAGVKNVIVTLGKRGAFIANCDGKQMVAAYPVTAVDTVAAGDAFNGALAAALVSGKTLVEAVRVANAVGALAVTKRGAIPSLPKRVEVERFLAEQAGK